MSFRTKQEAEAELGEFFGQYLTEWHPARDAQGEMTYNYVLEILRHADYAQPQCTDLHSVLDAVLTGDNEVAGVALQPLHELLPRSVDVLVW